MTKTVSQWCEELIARREYAFKKEDIEKTWEPVKNDLKKDEQIDLLICLIKKDSIFKWLYLISYYLRSLFSEEPNFMTLIEIVIDKIKGDMAQGVFIQSLINIGENDPERATNFYSKLTEAANETTIHYAGLILGGAAKKKFPATFGIIEKDLQKDSPAVKVACLKALRVTFETKGQIEFPEKIFTIMEGMLNNQQKDIRLEIIGAYIDFDKFNPDICEQKLLELAKSGDSLAHSLIASRLLFQNLVNNKKEIQILTVCAGDKDARVQQNILMILARKGQTFFDQGLDILKTTIKESSSYIPDLEYYVKEFCRSKEDHCIQAFKRWVSTEPEKSDKVFCYRVSNLQRSLEEGG